MPESSWSPWQPTETDLNLARMVCADSDRADFLARALAGVEALVPAFENSDWITVRRVVRTMRAYVAVDAEAPQEPVPVQLEAEIFATLAGKISEVAARVERTLADAA